MAPLQSRKRNSDEIETPIGDATPVGSPARKRTKISQPQKQALIDNLQLEVTERARHLRAHYALQCSDLRARVERRINRIPMGLRKANMGELYVKYAESMEVQPAIVAIQPKSAKAVSTIKLAAAQIHPISVAPQSLLGNLSSPARPNLAQPPSTRGKKRKSEIIIASDKENDGTEAGPESLPVAKNPKRIKAGPVSRQVSRTGKPNVLSPKSHNSRTLPQSPVKDHPTMPLSPTKPSYIARPISPLKPASPLKSAASAATSAISASIHGMVEHAKRGTAATAGKIARTASREKTTTTTKGKTLPPLRTGQIERTVSQSSNHSTESTSSTSTTVVKKGGSATTIVKQTTTSKKMAAATTSAAKTALKKNAATANKKVLVGEPATGRRVLRKRN